MHYKKLIVFHCFPNRFWFPKGDDKRNELGSQWPEQTASYLQNWNFSALGNLVVFPCSVKHGTFKREISDHA